MGSFNQSKLHTAEITETNSVVGTSSWKSTSDLVRRSLEVHGCVVVDSENIQAALPAATTADGGVFGMLKEVFELPLETKMKHKSGLIGFGYEGNYRTMPLFQCFGIEDGGTHQGVKEFTNLMWPHQGHDKFCETIHSYSKLLSELHNTVMKMVVSSYGLNKYYDNLVESSMYLTRLIEYRPPGEKESDICLQSHRDKSFLTVIGTNEVKGLQIENPDGEWIDFEPSPSKFLVLAGEAFMAWSNGRISSPLHRVVARRAEKEIRYSVGFFSFIDGILQVPEEFVDNQNPLKFKPFNNLEFLEYCKNGGGTTIGSAIKAYCGI